MTSLKNKFFMDNFDESIQNLQDCYNRLKEEKEKLKEQLTNWNKDKEIQRLQKEKDYILKHSLQQLNDKELQDDKEFKYSHYKSCGSNSYMYTLTGTGIGTCIEISCPFCKESKNITDYTCW